MSDQAKKSFKETLNLPNTDFSIRAKAKEKEPEILKRWIKENLYHAAFEKNKGIGKTFTLHDGPPFANGHIHMGHALNRTLKDIVLKCKRMSGYNVISNPGWDCHGLPIELKVVKELEGEQEGSSVEQRVAFKKKCREYAQKWIDVQAEELKRLGVVTDWEHPYITMDPAYEGAILECFADFVEKGYIERKGKTVPWCSSCSTVLATAEIEYQEKKDPSCYILFPFDKAVSEKVFPGVAEVSLLVWTTTPWTIPLNRAVVIHPTANYVLLEGKEGGSAFIVAEQIADKICAEAGIEKKVLKTFAPETLKNLFVNHPYVEDLQVPVLLDNMVLLDDGTACVHSAPGCGPEDYMVGVKNNLEIFSPITPDGKYSEGIQPKELEGMSVFDGQIWSIKKMAEKGRLFHKSSMRHSYPHCWRCHEPLIFRATDQWFCDLQKNDIVKKSIEAAEKLQFVPEWGKTRFTSSMGSRAEWCLSRQRQWGVPITALMCLDCNHVYLDADFVRSVAKEVAKEGVEFWDIVTVEDLCNKKILPKKFSCSSCGNKDLSKFKKETDIVDVWFESGVSHTAAKVQCPNLEIPADVYLEGSDQHRGWFQSSFLSSMIMYGKPCTKAFVTNAYVLDAQAQKMSKSKGNVISPQNIVEQYSADILRLWVAGSDFEGNILVSQESLKNSAEVYRKIRNTCRFIISNLYDFDPNKDAIAIEKLTLLDQYALARLQDVITRIKSSYEAYWFTDVFHTLNRYCNNELSSFYLDIIKDRLYTEKKDGHLRRSAQTAIHHILEALVALIAPILSFLAEEVSDFSQGSNKKQSIHLQNFPETMDVWKKVSRHARPEHTKSLEGRLMVSDPNVATFPVIISGWWNILEKIRPEILKAIEAKREVGLVKHSLEAKVTLYFDKSDEQGEMLASFISYVQAESEDVNRFFKDFFIVSQFEFSESPENCVETGFSWLKVLVEHADGEKCPRCWQWDKTEHEDGLCKRCDKVLQ